jgi:hypothetical protein
VAPSGDNLLVLCTLTSFFFPKEVITVCLSCSFDFPLMHFIFSSCEALLDLPPSWHFVTQFTYHFFLDSLVLLSRSILFPTWGILEASTCLGFGGYWNLKSLWSFKCYGTQKHYHPAGTFSFLLPNPCSAGPLAEAPVGFSSINCCYSLTHMGLPNLHCPPGCQSQKASVALF